MDNERVVWLARSSGGLSYAILLNECDASRWADDVEVYWDGDRLAWFDKDSNIVENVLGVELSPGEYCPVQINIKNML